MAAYTHLMKWNLFFAVFIGIFGLICQGRNHHHEACHFMPTRKIDTAFLTIQTAIELKANLTLMAVSSECYTCHLQPVAFMESGRNSCTILVDTRWPMRLTINSPLATEDCGEHNLNYWFVDGGNYTIYIAHKPHKVQCKKPIPRNSPMDSNIPIYVAIGAFVGLAVLWILLKKLMRSHFVYSITYRFSSHSNSFIDPADKKEKTEKQYAMVGEPAPKKMYNLRRRKGPNSSETAPVKSAATAQDLGMPTHPGEDEVVRPPRRERLKSLDTFRGISIVIMIFVNYRGGDYWFFRHSKWNGLTVADLVFPWFVWIMGTAMAYSFQSLLRRATPKSKIFWKIFKRSCILFALGLLINSSDGFNPARMKSFRVPGVLQRFAGTYLIIATLHMYFAKPNDPHQYTSYSSIRDVVDYWMEWVFNLCLVLLWLVLTFVLPVPGCPKGYLGPGGLANDGPIGVNVSNCTGGAASYIDRVIFGTAHIYQSPTCKEIYDTTVAHDPEGLLGTLTSCFMCFLGLQAGKILVTFPDWKARVKRFILWGIVLGIIAVILCKGEKDGGFIPINKNLWSLSFVICLSSFAFFLFAFCYVTIDVYKIWTGAPFYYPGMNAILLYLGHEMINQLFKNFWGIQPNSHTVYLTINIWDTAVWVLLSYFLHHKEIFFSV